MLIEQVRYLRSSLFGYFERRELLFRGLCTSCFVAMVSLIISFSGCATTPQPGEPLAHEKQPIAHMDDQDILSQAVLGSGDEIKVVVWRRDDLNRALRIGPSGIIFFPLVGEIQAAGLTPDEIRIKITEGLVEHVINPQVNVEVASYRNRKYYILGEVRKPGVFVIEDSVRVIEAIAMAGGFTWDARTNNVILVRQAPDHLELRSLNIDALLGKGELEQNVFLQRGDVVYVTPTTIVDIERFMKRFYTIILPLVEVERGIIFGYEVSDLIEGEATRVILPISR